MLPPSGASQLRPRRPRPPDWFSANNTAYCPGNGAGPASSVALVDSSCHCVSRPSSRCSIIALPPYDILDEILYQYIERRKGPAEIKEQGYDSALVDRILKLVNTNEYKRNQFCPIIRISPKAFGVGRRMPIVGKYLS